MGREALPSFTVSGEMGGTLPPTGAQAHYHPNLDSRKASLSCRVVAVTHVNWTRGRHTRLRPGKGPIRRLSTVSQWGVGGSLPPLTIRASE
jgi:hypothetical protein